MTIFIPVFIVMVDQNSAMLKGGSRLGSARGNCSLWRLGPRRLHFAPSLHVGAGKEKPPPPWSLLSAARLPRSGQGNRVPCEPCQDSSGLGRQFQTRVPGHVAAPGTGVGRVVPRHAMPDGPAARPCRLHQERERRHSSETTEIESFSQFFSNTLS